MSRLIDLAGQRFGMLEVLRFSEKRGRYMLWLCRCDCGVEKLVSGSDLRSGDSKSCGCNKSKAVADKLRKYPDVLVRDIVEYKIWQNIKTRCNNPNRPHYKDYGGRGIRVCDRWLNSFEAFLEDMGRRPQDGKRYTIERIDNNGNYEPGNCKWATYKEQSANTRGNRLIEFRGEMKSLTAWAEAMGLSNKVVNDRINRYKWSVERALTTPPYTPEERWKAVSEGLRERNTKPITCNGETLSVQQWAAKLGVHKDVIYTRLNKMGWTFEQAVTTPSGTRRLKN